MIADRVNKFDDLQRRTRELMTRLVSGLTTGMSDRDILRAATAMLQDFGFEGWFQPPIARMGASPGGLSRASMGRLEPGSRLRISLSPRAEGAWGDLSVTLRHGASSDELLEAARTCTLACAGYAARARCEGEIFVYARAWARNRRLLLSPDDAGYRVPSLELPPWTFPLSARLLVKRPTHRLRFLNSRRIGGLYVIAPCISDGTFTACFSEMVEIGGATERFLGGGPDQG
jgi:hypothetical protein